MVKLNDYIPSARAAEMLGHAASTKGANLSAKARGGKIPGAVKDGRDWFLPRIWVEEEMERKKTEEARGGSKRGRPRGNREAE